MLTFKIRDKGSDYLKSDPKKPRKSYATINANR